MSFRDQLDGLIADRDQINEHICVTLDLMADGCAHTHVYRSGAGPYMFMCVDCLQEQRGVWSTRMKADWIKELSPDELYSKRVSGHARDLSR